MSITKSEYDSWGNIINGLCYGLYFYYLNQDLFNAGGTDNTQVIGHSNAVVSVLYSPFLNESNLFLKEISYDNNRLGKMSNYGTLVENPSVFRITNVVTPVGEGQLIGTFDAYKVKAPTPGCKMSYKNESKLYQYPFTKLTVNDYINAPLEIQPQFLNTDTNKQGLYVKTTLSDKCTYMLYVKDYKGDPIGQTQGLISAGVMDLPCSSSAYSNFMSTSKAQFINSNLISRDNTKRYAIEGATKSGLSMIGSALSGRWGNLLGEAVNTGADIINARYDISNNILMENSKIHDLKTTPRAITSMGGDIPFSRRNSVNKVELIRYSLLEQELERVGNIFTMFGYKQNRLMKPNITTRYYFNYIKNVETNIDSTTIPNYVIDTLKEIHNKGITYWHVRDGKVDVNNYEYDNYEVR